MNIKIILLYIVFAIIATAVNLLTQWPFFTFLGGEYTIYIAIAMGTLSGLLTKYLFDKKWIFYFTPKDRKDDFYRFFLYSLMGVFTTLIFWGTEIGFYYFFTFKGSQYAGGALGLMVGYTLKFLLDRQFVFRRA